MSYSHYLVSLTLTHEMASPSLPTNYKMCSSKHLFEPLFPVLLLKGQTLLKETDINLVFLPVNIWQEMTRKSRFKANKKRSVMVSKLMTRDGMTM